MLTCLDHCSQLVKCSGPRGKVKAESAPCVFPSGSWCGMCERIGGVAAKGWFNNDLGVMVLGNKERGSQTTCIPERLGLAVLDSCYQW